MGTTKQAKKTGNGKRRAVASTGRHGGEHGEIEALERDRAELCSVLSHDLRNSLTVVLWSAQSLARSLPPDHPGRRQLEGIHRAGGDIELMLDDLSDVSRVCDGRLRLDVSPHQVASLIDEAALATQRPRQDKEIALDVQIAEGLGPVRCDQRLVTRVLRHLLAGAVAMTPKKHTVVVRAGPLEGEDGEVCLSVEDAGPGIPEDKRASLFDLPSAPPFGEPRRPRGPFPGLALFVARGIVEAHGGRLWVEGEAGRGSRFVLTLPAAWEKEN
jgi:signal transduction histidine kinase